MKWRERDRPIPYRRKKRTDNVKSLNEDLKTGNFKQIYLLCGEEAYLKKQNKERFIRAMLPEGDTMNYA